MAAWAFLPVLVVWGAVSFLDHCERKSCAEGVSQQWISKQLLLQRSAHQEAEWSKVLGRLWHHTCQKERHEALLCAMTKQKEFLPRQDLWLTFCSCAQHAFVYGVVLVQHISVWATASGSSTPGTEQSPAEMPQAAACFWTWRKPKKNITISFLFFCLFSFFFPVSKASTIATLFNRMVLYGYITAGQKTPRLFSF